MTTRERAKSIGAGVGVFALLLAAVVGVVLAVDILRAQNRVDAADAAFTSGVERDVTWDADTLLPVGVSRGILGLGDDVTYRNAVRRFWLSKPREPFRIFFPLAVLLGWVGVGHWLLYTLGVTASYSGFLHVN